jgi:hypothetical protein
MKIRDDMNGKPILLERLFNAPVDSPTPGGMTGIPATHS